MNLPPDFEAVVTASLRIAVVSTLFCALFGIPIAWLLSRRKVVARPLWEGLSTLPLVLPPTVLGYYLLVMLGHDSIVGRLYHKFTGSSIVFTWQGAAFAASIAALPLLIRTVQISMMAVSSNIIDAARLDGAGDITIFARLVLPLARHGMWAGIGLSFARALGDFGVTLMIGGNIAGSLGTHTMSLAVYDSINAGETSTASAYVLLLSLISFFFTIATSYLSNKRE